MTDAPAPSATPHGHYRAEGDYRVIDISLPSVPRLFSGLDPSPFTDRDLDPETEHYILSAAREIGAGPPIKIVFHLPPPGVSGSEAQSLAEAVHHFFAYREWVVGRDLHQLLRTGYASLAIGLSFLFLCLALRRTLMSHDTTDISILSEGLLIIGWVAMWRPLELFLYDWWPIWRQRRLLRRLRDVPVECRTHDPQG